MPGLVTMLLVRTKKGSEVEAAAGPSSGADPGQALDKAQLRRAQVRKAQIQHRQRKANYVKQLELDVARIRDLIDQTQRETQVLRRDNDTMKAQLRAVQKEENMFSLDGDLTVSLAFDDVLGAPTFRVVSSSSPLFSKEDVYDYDHSADYAFDGPAAADDATPEQTHEAINFILSLEHICRHHFGTSRVDDTHMRESGHTLMASSLALRGAPDAVFSAASRSAPLLRRATPSDVVADTDWRASGLTLRALHGLARSLADPDVELTPVQAWFDLAARWPVATLVRPDVLAALKRELAPIVRCPHYGAQMEREAYESVVGRVLGAFTEQGEPRGEDEVMMSP